MSQVRLEDTPNRRRLHIGAFFVDLNETDYRELIDIFGKESGNPIHTLANAKSKKYDDLEEQISNCFEEGSGADITTIGEIAASHFGYL